MEVDGQQEDLTPSPVAQLFKPLSPPISGEQVCKNPKTCQWSVAVKNVTDAEFEAAVLHADLPVLVDFWAPWCGPCRLVAPLMDWAANTYGDRLLVMKMEVDPNPATRDQYKVQGIPSLLVFRGGEVIARHEGALSQKQLQTFLDAHL